MCSCSNVRLAVAEAAGDSYYSVILILSFLLLVGGFYDLLARVRSGHEQQSGEDQVSVPTSDNGHRTHRLQCSPPFPPEGKFRPSAVVWFSLTEVVPASARDPEPFRAGFGGEASSPPRRRLTTWGQLMLSAALLLASLTVYLGAWEISRRITSHGEICQKLSLTSPSEVHEGFPMQSQLLRDYEIGKELIRALPSAYPGQRLRLTEQLYGLVTDLDGLCRLSIYYLNEESALLTAATSSASLLIISLVMLAPQGFQNISRSLRTVVFTAGAILGLSVNFLQLGQQQVNGVKVEEVYRSHYALLQRFTSSLANQRIEAGISASQVLLSLTTPLAVAQLITAIDTKRLSMPDPRMEFDSSLAKQIWMQLLKGDGDGEPSPPLDKPPAHMPASTNPPRPSPPT